MISGGELVKCPFHHVQAYFRGKTGVPIRGPFKLTMVIAICGLGYSPSHVLIKKGKNL